MIKLFRNIRQNLLAEGKTSRYLKYAIGEIILVVIGILIALSINNWNQDKINKNIETKYYSRLLEDLKEEEATSQAFINYTEQVSLHAKKAILFFEKKHDLNEHPTQDLIDLYQASQILDARPVKSTYQELVSSGQLNIFQNDSIKTSIINYYNNDWSESLVFRFTDRYRDNLRSKMPYEIQEKIRNNCGDSYKSVRRSITVHLPQDCEIDIPIEISKPALASLLSDTKLKEDLRYLIGNQESKFEYLKNVKIQLQDLINQIETIDK